MKFSLARLVSTFHQTAGVKLRHIAASQQIVSRIIQCFLGLSICSAPETRHCHTEFPAHLKTSGLLCNFMKPRQCDV
jgi:hypothetical protein